MPTVPVPIFQEVYKGVDGSELSEQNLSLYDGYRDELGATRSRPGSTAFATIDSSRGVGMDGLWYWREKNRVIAVAAGSVYDVTSDGTVTNKTSAATMLSGNPVTFATDGTNVVLANGGQPAYLTLSSNLAYISDSDAPPICTHVAYLDGYILASGGGNTFKWSDVTSSLSWGGLNFASAAGSPDDVVALHVLNREIYLFGQSSVEIWEDDGTTPFARVAGGFIESGCSAPYSVLLDGSGIFYWLNQFRRLVRFNGKTVERVSGRYDAEIQSLSTVSDCRAYVMEFGNYTLLVFNFPSANRTFVYNQTVDDWAEWGKWDAERIAYDRWVGQAYCYAEGWGKHLIGRYDKRVIAELSSSYTSDDGDLIRVCRTTGHVNYGTLKRKKCDEFRIRCRRGDGLSGADAKLVLRVREDNQSWGQPKQISLGNLGDYETIVRVPLRGIYRSRQYEFTASDAAPIVFLGAEEDVEVLS